MYDFVSSKKYLNKLMDKMLSNYVYSAKPRISYIIKYSTWDAYCKIQKLFSFIKILIAGGI